MNTFKEGEQYRLFIDLYNYILLNVSYIESNTIWLSNSDSCYKYDRKSKKLYVFNTKVQAYDLVEGTLAEYGVEQVWEIGKVMMNVYDYLE